LDEDALEGRGRKIEKRGSNGCDMMADLDEFNSEQGGVSMDE
jgi:hypothetical protein